MPVVRLSQTNCKEGVSPSISLASAEHTTVSETLGEDGDSVIFCIVGSVFSMVALTVVVS